MIENKDGKGKVQRNSDGPMQITSARMARRLRPLSGQSDIVSEFWQQWLAHKDALYQCCLKLMNWNWTEAEDALSRAMLKACKKVQELPAPIKNFKAWLMRLTRNLCIDIIREGSREVAGVENISCVRPGEVLLCMEVSPLDSLEREEKLTEIRRAIASLPERLRSTFILHYYEEYTHREIAQIQEISYDNVCKRISEARKILKTKLSGYFQGSDSEVGASESAGLRSPTPPKEQRDPKADETVTATTASECIQSAGDSAGLRSPTPPIIGEKQLPQEQRDPKTDETVTATTASECIQVVVREKTVKGAIEPIDPEREKISEEGNVGSEQLLSSRLLIQKQTRTTEEKFTPIVGAGPDLSARLRSTTIEQYNGLRSSPEMAHLRFSTLMAARADRDPRRLCYLSQTIAPVLVRAQYAVGRSMLELSCWREWIDSGGLTEVKSRQSTSRQIDSS